MKIIKTKYYLTILIIIVLISISAVDATDLSNSTTGTAAYNENQLQTDENTIDSSSKLINDLSQANDNDIIILEKGTYKVSDFEITKNLLTI